MTGRSPATSPPVQKNFRTGYVALVGAANAGKSTLFNKLMRMPLAPVSFKAQTTRRKLSGVYNFSLPGGITGQAILLDLPGYISEETRVSKLAVEIEQATKDGAKVADLLVLVLDSRRDLPVQVNKFLEQKYEKPFFVVMNVPARLNDQKVKLFWDAVHKNEFYAGQPLLFFDQKWPAFEKKFSKLLGELLPAKTKLLTDPENYTLENLKELARERILEKCFLNLKEEVPYEMDAHIFQYVEEKTIHKIYVDLLVSREKYKPIVIGSRGSMLRKIGESSRRELEEIFGTKIFLSLNVKVKPDWQKNQSVLHDLGYAKRAQVARPGAGSRPRKAKR